ncbi:MAG: rhodanese-like domain-containing protein [Actinomycetota bacterium]|nr:rhodanese-like domain-containing protein [Actinomycetota bacterium]
MIFESVDSLLSDARIGLRRLTPRQAESAVRDGSLIVDIRPEWQRRNDGEIPGSIVVERNHLEWRLHPNSGASILQARPGQEWIVVCTEGYTSSLAAASLNSLGILASDVIGGIYAWREARLPVAVSVSTVETVVSPHAQALGVS